MSIQYKQIVIVIGLQVILGCGSAEQTTECKVELDSKCNQYIINISDFGALGDGVHDDYRSIMDAVESINVHGYGTLVFDKKVYRINQHRIDGGSEKNDIKSIKFKNLSCLKIEGHGSTIDVDGNWTRVADINNSNFTYSYHNSIGMKFLESHNIIIENLTLDGNADKTTKKATAEGSSHGLSFSSCSNVKIENVYIHHYQADGLYIGTTTQKDTNGTKKHVQSKHFVVNNSNFTNNARQGCTISQLRDANFTNCIFSDTGKTGLYGGHSPQAGVDIEPNYWVQTDIDDNTGYINFKNCTFSDNVGFEYIGSNHYTTPYPIKFDNCIFKNSRTDIVGSKYSAVVPASAKSYFDNCTFDEVALWANYASKNDSFIKVYVFNSTFKSTIPSQSVLFAVDRNNTFLHVEGCRFDLNATQSAAGKYRFFLRNADVIFEDNEIFISKKEHFGHGEDVKFLLQKGVQTFSNHWRSDLNQTNSYFSISYEGSVDDGDTYAPNKSFHQRN